MAGTADLLRSLLAQEERYRRLWRAHMERTPVSDVHGALLWDSLERDLAPGSVVPAAPVPDEDGRDGEWEATLVHEQLTLTPHGRLARRRVTKVIRALEPLTRVRLPVARGQESVVVRHGATCLPARPGAGAVDLHLPQPLAAADSALLEYDVVPLHASTVTGTRTCLERSAATSTVILLVRFHPGRLPREVWWRRWQGEAEEQRLPASLGPQHDVQTVLTGARGGAVGLSWRW